jgi:hypothetical protein
MVELHVTPIPGDSILEPATQWNNVFCEVRRGQVQFAEGPGAVRETAAGAIFSFRRFSSHGDPQASDQFSGSYCSFKESSGAWHYAVMHG